MGGIDSEPAKCLCSKGDGPRRSSRETPEVARLTDPERLRHYTVVLSLWKYECYVHWRQLAAEWVYRELDGMTLRGLGRLMREHVIGGGAVDEIVETRPEYRDVYAFHHDLRLTLPNGRAVYVETVLETEREPEDSMILVVNIHDR